MTDKDLLEGLIDHLENSDNNHKVPIEYLEEVVTNLGGCFETACSLSAADRGTYINLLFMRSLSNAL